MIRSTLFVESPVRKIVAQEGAYQLIEYTRDVSVNPGNAANAWFCAEMNVHKRQVLISLDGSNSVVLQSGAMQLMTGTVNVATNVKGAGDLLKKAFSAKVTGESAIKPRYAGIGYVLTEPTYNYILFENLAHWNGNMVVDDGMFLACDSTVEVGVARRKSVSGALAGGEGFFNPSFRGQGIVVLESPVPREELIVIELENDTVRIDGSMAVAWSDSLDFTVERTTTTIVGSAASGEGLVNVYRGTGRVLVGTVGAEAMAQAMRTAMQAKH